MKKVTLFNKILLILILSLGLGLNTVSAHSFNLILIAPISELSGQQERDGFLLATREQDSHADETSDGHLGGLDSHVRKIDSAQGTGEINAQLQETIDNYAPLFGTGLNIEKSQLDKLNQTSIVLVDPTSRRDWTQLVKAPDRIPLMNRGVFTRAFLDSYNYAPGPAAIHGYLSARAIAFAVRNSDEKGLMNPDNLRKLVDEFYQSRL